MAYVSKINGYDIKDSEARGDVSTLKESMTTAQGDIETLQNDLSDTKADLGDVTQLETTVKTSAVNAINEVKGEADDNASSIAQNTANFAPAFSDVTSYAVGDFVTYNGVLYKCTTEHSAGAWVAGHFTQVTVGGTLNDIVPGNASSSNKLTTESDTDYFYQTSDVEGEYNANNFIVAGKITRYCVKAPVNGFEIDETAWWGYYETVGFKNNGYGYQTFRTMLGSPAMAIRQYYSGGWGAWNKICTENTLKSVVAASTDFEDFKTRIAAL